MMHKHLRTTQRPIALAGLILTLAATVSSGQQSNPLPRYPDALRVAGVEGTVAVQFTADATGAVDSTTLKVLSATNDAFTAAVLAVVPHWRVVPGATMERRFVFLMQDRLATLSPDPTGRSVYITAPRPAASSQNVYFEFQVERRAVLVDPSSRPQYPDSLRGSNLEGEVLAQFVVDTAGNPVLSTFRILKAAHPLFIASVRNALPSMKFEPARVSGRAVSQLVQMPFNFTPPKS
jgi:TonB family protein